MDSEKEEEKQSTEDTGEGNKSETTTLFERTDAATKRLEEANAKTEELLNRQEELYARQKLGGRAEAGQPSEKKEETPVEYVKRIESEGL